MKFKKIYLSVIFFLSLLGLTGCTYEKYDVKFLDSSYNRFDYKGEHYGVTNQLISYEDIESKVAIMMILMKYLTMIPIMK